MMLIKTWWDKFKAEFLEKSETEFLPAILEVTETPPSPVGRLVMWTVIVLLIAGGLWAFLGHVDEVAIANGKIVPIGQVKVIQAEDKGIVKSIFVQDGQRVQQGDVLLELDETVTAADLAVIKKQIAYYNLEISRLTAELNNAPFTPSVSPDLDPKDLLFQTQLYNSRVAEYRTKQSTIAMQIQQGQATTQTAQANLKKYQDLLEISKDKESRLETLADQNAVSLFQVLEERSKRMELAQNVSAQTSEINRARSTLAESQQKLQNVTDEYHKEIMTAMVEARKQLTSNTEQLKKAEEKNRLSRIVAPVSGRVAQLSVHTVGGIVTAAQALMTVVPDDTEMEVEAWADNKDIGFLKVGQKAEIKVTTFNFQKFGVIDATLDEISPDAVETNDKQKDKKFRLVFKLDQADMAVGNGSVALSPGMEVVAEAKIRQKRIYEFFLDPFRQYQSEALRER